MCGSVSLYGLCISSYYGKYGLFDLQVTLTLIFYLQMTLSLVKASQHCKIIHYEHFEVFDLEMTLTFHLDHGENFTIWCHCIISYYEQFEVFDLEMTLTFDLQLYLTLTNTLLVLEQQHFIRRK